ncbi:urocanate hydratase [candidate division CSSED10-310 bacterium]|uniref:Urocanate hydratase n=1 Tax=candidate division CSSED10-310 bacterium TaxID=2855610 RepID=A0ABV6YW26_UNCC1
MIDKTFYDHVACGLPVKPEELPPFKGKDPDVNHAPPRQSSLSPTEKKLALKNALRYFDPALHYILAAEFLRELEEEGRIYMFRLRPTAYEMKARHIDNYPARSKVAAAIMLMITNNLDPAVAQHPHELITYGGNGAVFQNWAQYHLVMKYLSEMTDEQTLVIYSGHPLGLFPSHREAPRVVLTNGMVIPNYSSLEDYNRLNALGVTSYGQMTAGSYMYIGPQGIVHGTAITLLNAGREYLNIKPGRDLRGKLFVTSGLGGMSGAQAKASVIAGAVGLIAEINPQAIQKRYDQGWLNEIERDLDQLIIRIKKACQDQEAVSIGYLGNIVDLWEKLDRENVQVHLGSDQTSLHNPYNGGYYPASLTFDESNLMMVQDPNRFKAKVQESLRRQSAAIISLADKGMHFWDYGNAFLLEASRAGAPILKPDGRFLFPSYVEDIMGPLCFDYGFGPFRWVVTSNDPADLALTDQIAADVLEKLLPAAEPAVRQQLSDNLLWIKSASENDLVVGSQARILYSHEPGRIAIALAFNEAIREKKISAPVVLGRDHHDVSGTDSPYRETANIYDGSNLCADMAVHNVIGDSFRGASWVSLHNGGGVGWGEVINGGFGLVLDGTEECDHRIKSMISWDVNNGLARRAWARNQGALFAANKAMEREPRLKITIPHETDAQLIDPLF